MLKEFGTAWNSCELLKEFRKIVLVTVFVLEFDRGNKTEPVNILLLRFISIVESDRYSFCLGYSLEGKNTVCT